MARRACNDEITDLAPFDGFEVAQDVVVVRLQDQPGVQTAGEVAQRLLRERNVEGFLVAPDLRLSEREG